MSRVGSACQDAGTLVKHTKNELTTADNQASSITWGPGIGMPRSLLSGDFLHVIAFTEPAK